MTIPYVATAPSAAADLNKLATGFTNWLGKSGNARAWARHPAAARAPVFSGRGAEVSLNATSASRLIRSGRVGELVALLGLPKKEDLSRALNANSTSLWRWAHDDAPLPIQAV